jgi:hypothetical protein
MHGTTIKKTGLYSSFDSIQKVPLHHFTGEKGLDPSSGNIQFFPP